MFPRCTSTWKNTDQRLHSRNPILQRLCQLRCRIFDVHWIVRMAITPIGAKHHHLHKGMCVGLEIVRFNVQESSEVGRGGVGGSSLEQRGEGRVELQGLPGSS